MALFYIQLPMHNMQWACLALDLEDQAADIYWVQSTYI